MTLRSHLIVSSFLTACLFFSCKSEPTKKVKTTVGYESRPVPVPQQEVEALAIGMKAPDFNLPGVDGTYHSLSDYDHKKILAVIFTCNHCPTAQAYEQRIMDITRDYQGQGVQVIAISPNSPLGLLYEELGYSDLGDTYEDMIARAEDASFNFPYLYDGDNQRVSLAYGPAATPQCFVFDEERTLRYVGRIDGSEKPGTAHGEDLRAALDQLIAGEVVTTASTKTFGCSTKWGWKTEMREKIDNEWSLKDVTLSEVDLNEVKRLMDNESDQLRLVNLWATWCAPCRLEYPDFVIIQRMFGARDFEFISLSADKLEKKDRALEFLKSKSSSLRNYISKEDDKYALIEAVDPDWNGALPYTALLEPGGKVVWSHQGSVDFRELKKVIVDHPMIGRVY